MENIPIEVGTLTTLLNIFEDAFTGGYSKIFPDAMHLLALLATLEVAIAALWWMLCEENTTAELLKKIMKIGFFIFVVAKYPYFVTCVVDGFVYVGLKAGGAGTGTASISLIKDPSAIISLGFDLIKPIDAAIAHYNPLNVPKIMLAGLAELMVILAFFALAIGVFITYLEFYLISVLGLILMPFGACKYTAFLAEKVIGGIISFGVRLMVLSFILVTAKPILASLVMPANPDFNQVLILFLITATIAGLSWHASAVAGGLLSGSPSLSAGTVASTGLAVAAGVAGAGMAVSTGISATRAAAGALKTAHSAGRDLPGSTSAASSPGSSGGPSGGRTGGPIGGISESDSPSVGSSSRSSSAAGGSTGGVSGSSSAPSVAKTGQEPKKGSSAIPSWALLAMAQRAIPQDAHPGPGVSVPIRHDS